MNLRNRQRNFPAAWLSEARWAKQCDCRRKGICIYIATSMLILFIPSAHGAEPASRPLPPAKFHIGHLEPKGLEESSGLIASRLHPGVFWTHNDSDNPPEIFAVTREGKEVATFSIAAKNIDWEDIAYDEQGKILIADIGNNNRDRKEVYVYRVAEPKSLPAVPQRGPAVKPLPVEQTWTLAYPAEPFDAESLFVRGNQAFVVSKLRNLKKAGLYVFELDPTKPRQALKLVCDLPIRYPATGADLSPDGKRLVILTVGGPYLFDMPRNVEDLAKASPAHVFYTQLKMEGCCFVPEGVLATTEDRDVFLFRWKDFGVKAE